MIRPSRSRMIHRVDVYLGNTEATGPSGGLDVSPAPVLESVPCMITDEGGDRVMAIGQLGREIERKRATVIFLDPIDLKLGHSLIYTTPAGKTRTFLVDSFRDDQDQGRLWVARCTEQPDASSE